MFSISQGAKCKPAEECVFPFTYNGRTYNQCTNVDSSAIWCSVSSTYISGGPWRTCECEGRFICVMYKLRFYTNIMYVTVNM